jgi:hypothetical protein
MHLAAVRRHIDATRAGTPPPRLLIGLVEREAVLQEALADCADPGHRIEHIRAAAAPRTEAARLRAQAGNSAARF